MSQLSTEQRWDWICGQLDRDVVKNSRLSLYLRSKLSSKVLICWVNLWYLVSVQVCFLIIKTYITVRDLRCYRMTLLKIAYHKFIELCIMLGTISECLHATINHPTLSRLELGPPTAPNRLAAWGRALDFAAISATLEMVLRRPPTTSLCPHLHGAIITSLSVHHIM